MNKRPTMPDVARDAGVSLKTVSRVVNGEHGVRPVTVKRVRDAIDRLDYRPNQLARGLRGRTSSTIGLVVTDLGIPFYARLARSIEDVVRHNDQLIFVASSAEDSWRERQLVQSFIERWVDGLIIVPATDDETYVDALGIEGTPVVFVDRSPRQPVHDVVVLDNQWAASEAVKRLVRLGCRRIAMVGLDPSMYFTEARVAGYHEGLRQADLEADESLVLLGSRLAEEAQKTLTDRLDQPDPPDGVLAANYTMALGVVRALLDHGLHLPVAAFDEFELSDALPMPFVTVTNDPVAMGKAAASMLSERIAGYEGPPRRVVLTPNVSSI